MIHADSSSDEYSSSSDEDDLAILFLEASFVPKRVLGPHIAIEDIAEDECPHLFRY